jgi:hypothetical protein
LAIAVTASDGVESVASSFNLVVQPVNDAPLVVAPLATVTVDEDTAVDFIVPAGSFADPDGDALTLSATLASGNALPGWLSFADGRFTGTPPANFAGTLALTVIASDGVAATPSNFVLVIRPVNDAPVVALPLADRQVTEGAAVDFTLPAGSFTDVDSSALTLAATLANGGVLPSWLHFDAVTGHFSGTAPAGAATVDVRVAASDGLATASDVFTLAVVPDDPGAGSSAGFAFANLNSWYNPAWGGGYIVTFNYTVQAEAIEGGHLLAWDILAGYSGTGQIVGGWLNSFNGGASFTTDGDSATFSTVTQGYKPDLAVGTSFQLSLQISGAAFHANDFDFTIFDRDPLPNRADALDTHVDAAPTNDWGGGLGQSVSLRNISNAGIDDWKLVLDVPDGIAFDLAGVWGATGVRLANGDILFTAAEWNDAIPAGGAVSFGFNANYSGVASLQLADSAFGLL